MAQNDVGANDTEAGDAIAIRLRNYDEFFPFVVANVPSLNCWLSVFEVENASQPRHLPSAGEDHAMP